MAEQESKSNDTPNRIRTPDANPAPGKHDPQTKQAAKEKLDDWSKTKPGQAGITEGDSNPDVGQLPGTAAKAVGGGLEAKSTNLGSAAGSGGSAPQAGAAGNSVTAAGRPLRTDERSTIGSAPLPTVPSPAAAPGKANLDSSSASPSTSGQRARPTDLVEGRADATAGTEPGTGRPDLQAAAEGTPEDKRQNPKPPPAKPA